MKTANDGYSEHGDRDIQAVDYGSSKVARQIRVNSFEVLGETVQEPATAHGVVESYFGKYDSLQQLCGTPNGRRPQDGGIVAGTYFCGASWTRRETPRL